MNSPRTIVIGLDGATFDLIDPLIAAGVLPTLKRIIAEGVRGTLQTWPNTNSAAAWSSMVTGYNSGQHGIFHFGEAITRRGASWRPVTAVDRRKDAFWRILSAAGQRVGVINVPITYPADKINGFMLAGMDAPSVHSSGFAHPADLPTELRRQGIDYVIDVPNLGRESRRDPYYLPERVERLIDTRSRTVLQLMRTQRWDALMAVFVATDRVQHYFWPGKNSPVDAPDWLPISCVYQKIDSFLAQVLDLIDSNTTLLLVSDHGFGPERSGQLCLNQLFNELGLLHYRRRGDQFGSRVLKNLLAGGRRHIPPALQGRLARAMPKLHLRAVSAHRFSGVDWPRTQVFVGGGRGNVSINLKGREPDGAVSAQDYDALRRDVTELLQKLTDPVTNESVVKAVRPREDVYIGPYLDRAADLLIEWDYSALRDSLACDTGQKRVIVHSLDEKRHRKWNGTHRSQGILIARGPNIKRGAAVSGAAIYDIAATILYLQNHPVPEDSDGVVLTALFSEEFLRERPVMRYKQDPIQDRGPEAGLDPSEARKIEERLRGLGYIE